MRYTKKTNVLLHHVNFKIPEDLMKIYTKEKNKMEILKIKKINFVLFYAFGFYK